MPAGLTPESEANDTAATATPLALTSAAAGTATGTAVGAVAGNDAGDFYSLGTVGAGTVIQAAAVLPAASTLVPQVQILLNGAVVLDADGVALDGAATFTAAAAGTYTVRVAANAGAGVTGHYLLQVTLADTTPPAVVSTSLPAAGTTGTGVVNGFTVTFSEEMAAAGVNSPVNVSLVAAGPDGAFGTADDVSYPVAAPGYAGGATVSYALASGPLQPGSYRLTLSNLADRAGNALPTFTRLFGVAATPGYTIENRSNDTSATATPLTLVESPTGLFSAGGQGSLTNTSDYDNWGFSGTAGQKVVVSAEAVPGGSGLSLYYEVRRASDDAFVTNFYTADNGRGQSAAASLPTTAAYVVRVRYNNDYRGEYRFRLALAGAGVQLESENNSTTSNATPVTLSVNGTTKFATAAGFSPDGSDLDYFNLGSVAAGNTIYLTSRAPAGSPHQPTVAVYDASNGYVAEAGAASRPFDGVAEVRVTAANAGTFYAVMRAAGGSGTLNQYLMDVQILPTGSVVFPNLIVTAVSTPGTSASGQTVPVTFTVANQGSQATNAAGWSDRLVLSRDTVVGNGDDVVLGTLAHAGVLNPGDAYTVNASVRLPDGVSGDFYVLVQADVFNDVSEFLLEGDNTTASAATFRVNLADYADVRVEGLAVGTPAADGATAVTWTTANRGTGATGVGFKERVVVTNTATSAVVSDVETDVPALAAGATAARSRTVTLPGAGPYSVSVTVDSRDAVYEYAAPDGHAFAEANNVASAATSATLDLTVANLRTTPAAGLQSGGALTVAWDTRNAGTFATPGSFSERLTVVNRDTGVDARQRDRPVLGRRDRAGGECGPVIRRHAARRQRGRGHPGHHRDDRFGQRRARVQR